MLKSKESCSLALPYASTDCLCDQILISRLARIHQDADPFRQSSDTGNLYRDGQDIGSGTPPFSFARRTTQPEYSQV